MTDAQIDCAIAEHMGWKDLHEIQQIAAMHHGWCGVNPESGHDEFIPEYCHDLNAMFEAEKTLLGGAKFFSKGGKSTYIWNLKNVCALGKNLNVDKDFYLLIHIPARQRAEAFLKTIGKWEDS